MERERALRVLLIDDNDADAFLVEMALRGAGLSCELERFADGADALLALRARAPLDAPDVVLLDLDMPRSEGGEVLRELRAIPGLAATPVALFSTELPPGFERSALVRCVKKPLHLDDFLSTVVEAVRDLARDAEIHVNGHARPRPGPSGAGRAQPRADPRTGAGTSGPAEGT